MFRMSDSGSEQDVEQEEEDQGKQAKFVRVLKKYPVLLEKSQIPAMKAKKEAASEAAIKDLESLYGQSFTKSTLSKKISRIKGEVKAKSDKTKTGNKKIILKPWESELL